MNFFIFSLWSYLTWTSKYTVYKYQASMDLNFRYRFLICWSWHSTRDDPNQCRFRTGPPNLAGNSVRIPYPNVNIGFASMGIQYTSTAFSGILHWHINVKTVMLNLLSIYMFGRAFNTIRQPFDGHSMIFNRHSIAFCIDTTQWKRLCWISYLSLLN